MNTSHKQVYQQCKFPITLNMQIVSEIVNVFISFALNMITPYVKHTIFIYKRAERTTSTRYRVNNNYGQHADSWKCKRTCRLGERTQYQRLHCKYMYPNNCTYSFKIFGNGIFTILENLNQNKEQWRHYRFHQLTKACKSIHFPRSYSFWIHCKGGFWQSIPCYF